MENLIPANQHLYAVDRGTDGMADGRIWKVPRSYFANYVGDVLVTDEGLAGGPTRHVILHWDGQSFVAIDLINTNAIEYEQAIFSPTSFSSH